MKYALIVLGLGSIVLLAYALEPQKPKPTATVPQAQAAFGMVQIGTTTIPVELADTAAKRTQGLSGRAALPPGTGMLFTFEREGPWGIWMKDMLFSIDIVWADSEGRIVSIERQVSPQTYPNAFYPSAPARYVLEVSAGFADLHGIAEGQQLVVQ